MHKYLIRRLLMLIPVILGVTLIVFTIMYLTPGSPAQTILGEQAPEEAVAKLEEEMGLNDPFIVQYGRYVKNALQGDFGRSYQNNRPVFREIVDRFPSTLKLTAVSTVIAILLGIPIGIISSTRQYSLMDSITMVIALIGGSRPLFFFGVLLVLLFSVQLKLLPAAGAGTWKHVVLPAIALGAQMTATVTRMTRSSMLEVIRQDYIRTARAKGVSEHMVIFKHALKNALIPIITVVGLQFGGLLGGAVLTETVFAWPGVGLLMVNGIKMKDTPIVLASVIFLAVTFSVVNLLVDVLYAFVDPRVRTQYR